MKKSEIIKKINAIIEEYGSFGVGEIMADHSPCVASSGNIVSLAEGFRLNEAEIEVYNCKSISSDSIDSYVQKYDSMKKEVLEDILKLAEQYKEMNE